MSQFQRPWFHASPPVNWMSDPNGLIFTGGFWHLYYQHNPHGEDWGHMSWGHLRSADLVCWEPMAPALLANEQHFAFSGCIIEDHANRAGYGAHALIAIYTGASTDGTKQAQHLAVSLDGGDSFVADEGGAILDLNLADFRDPNIFWHEPSGQWVMVVALSAENRASIYASDDLRSWRHLSDIGPWGAPGEIWECPMLIELPVDGTAQTRWLFKVDVLSGGPGSGALALSGTFDGTAFAADRAGENLDWEAVDTGRDFYAAVPWHEPRDERGRPCWIGWIGNHRYQGALPRVGWRGAMSLPKRISFRHEGERYRLLQQVDPTVLDLLDPRMTLSATQATCQFALSSCLSFELAADDEATILLTSSDSAAMTLRFTDGLLHVTRAAGFHVEFDEPILASIEPGPVRIWLDQSIMEVETASGRDWVTVQHRLFGDHVRMDLVATREIEVSVAIFQPHIPQTHSNSRDVEGDGQSFACLDRRRRVPGR